MDKKRLQQLIIPDPNESEQTARKKYGFFPFIILQIILFSLSIFVLGISIYIIILCLKNKISNLSGSTNIDEVIACFQPCITGFAMSQIFIVSAFTLSDLRVLWANSELINTEETKDTYIKSSKKTKINLIMEFVLSSILLGFIILVNDVIKLDLKLNNVIQVTLFLACLMGFIVLMKDLIIPIIYRYQLDDKIKIEKE
jgi:hypothetical protein